MPTLCSLAPIQPRRQETDSFVSPSPPATSLRRTRIPSPIYIQPLKPPSESPFLNITSLFEAESRSDSSTSSSRNFPAQAQAQAQDMPTPAILALERQVFLQSGVDINRPLPSIPMEETQPEERGSGPDLKEVRPLELRAAGRKDGENTAKGSIGAETSLSWLEEIIYSYNFKPSHSRSTSAGGKSVTFGTVEYANQPTSGVESELERSIAQLSSLPKVPEESPRLDGAVSTPDIGVGSRFPTPIRKASEFALDDYQSRPSLPSQLIPPPRLPAIFTAPYTEEPSPPIFRRPTPNTNPSPDTPTSFSDHHKALAQKTRSALAATKSHVRAASESSVQIVQFAGREARQAVGKGLKVLEEVKGEILDHLEGKREVEDEVEREMVITSPWTVRHDLHVSEDFRHLPAEWLEILSAQGISNSELKRLASTRNRKLAAADKSLLQSSMTPPSRHKRASRSLPEAIFVKAPDVSKGEHEVPFGVDVREEDLKLWRDNYKKEALKVKIQTELPGRWTFENSRPREKPNAPEDENEGRSFGHGKMTVSPLEMGESNGSAARGDFAPPPPPRRRSPAPPRTSHATPTTDSSSSFTATPTTPEIKAEIRTPAGEKIPSVLVNRNYDSTKRSPLLPDIFDLTNTDGSDLNWADSVIQAILATTSRNSSEWKLIRLPSENTKREQLKDKERRERKERKFRQFQEQRFGHGVEVGVGRPKTKCKNAVVDLPIEREMMMT